jgi:hypothetical protein
LLGMNLSVLVRLLRLHGRYGGTKNKECPAQDKSDSLHQGRQKITFNCSEIWVCLECLNCCKEANVSEMELGIGFKIQETLLNKNYVQHDTSNHCCLDYYNY